MLVKVWHCTTLPFRPIRLPEMDMSQMRNAKTDEHSCCWAFHNRSMHIGFPKARSEGRTGRMPPFKPLASIFALQCYLETVQTWGHLHAFVQQFVQICTCLLLHCALLYKKQLQISPGLHNYLLANSALPNLKPSSKACLSNIMGLVK